MARLATITNIVGTALLFCSVCVLQGFRKEVGQKVFSFGGHAQVRRISSQENAGQWVSDSGAFYKKAKSLPQVAALQSAIIKPCLMRATQETEGLVLKGIAKDFYKEAFAPNILSGKLPTEAANDSSLLPVMISKKIATKLLVKPGDEVTLYFLQEPPRFRKGVICGIYQTGLEEYDESVCLARAADLQDLDNWRPDKFTGFEVYFHNADHIDGDFDALLPTLDYYLEADKITNLQIQIFDWLDIIGRNVQIILILICIVACFNSAGTMLIFALEKVRVVGILKSLGMPNRSLTRLFWLLGIRIALKGILIGNAVGFGVCLIQQQFRLFPLNPENYYVTAVPIVWNIPGLIWVNVALLASLALSLVIPAVFASRTSPVEAMRVR